MKPFLPIILILSFLSCEQPQQNDDSLNHLLKNVSSVKGKSEYLPTPFVAAGNRVYAVGNQDGTFPDIGWHVTGEMGGVWDHPIKLLDGYVLGVSTGGQYYCLDNATEFINYPMANQHLFHPSESLKITRTQFVPDDMEGMVVEFEFENSGNKSIDLELDFAGMVDLRPVWLAERQNISDRKDSGVFDEENQAWIAKDSLNDWFVAIGSSAEITAWQQPAMQCSYERKVNEMLDLALTSEVKIPANDKVSVQYFISGSYTSRESAIETLKQLKINPKGLLKAKIDRYQKIESIANLSIPDTGLQQLYTWTKYTTDWLIREVPEQGRGLSAGIPDYPWWFGTDNTFALQGLLATGQHEEVKTTMDLILKLSQDVNDNGRIMHETSTNGVVFNPGNLNTTPYFINLIWKYYQWTGDKEFLEKVYPEVKKGITWLESQDKEGNGYPDGAGMMEIHGLHSEMIDVVSYSWAAYQAAANMAEVFHEHDFQQAYQDKADLLAKQINRDWWVEQAGSFADFRASRVETLQLIDAAIVRADTINKPWAVEELKALKQQIGRLRDNRIQGQVVHHNWVVNTPMEVGVANPEHAEAALATAKKYSSKYGMYVTGIDRDESKDESSKWKAFSYVGAVMTLPTGVQAISEARYGNPDESLKYLKMLENSFSYALPGSMYEVSPDYGMIAQAWNIYAVAVPIVEYFFGVKPNAVGKEVTFQPNFPSTWKMAKLDNIRVGDNLLSIEKSKSGYRINQTSKGWKINLIIPDPGKDILVNGEEVRLKADQNEMIKIELTAGVNSVEF